MLTLLVSLAQEAAATALPSNQIILPPQLTTPTEAPWTAHLTNLAIMTVVAIGAAIIPFVARAFGALAQKLVNLLEGWLKVRAADQVQTQIKDITERSVAYADEWAHNERAKGVTPTGPDKLAQATTFATEQINTFKVDAQSGEFIQKMIQATLGARRESVAVKVAAEVARISQPPVAPAAGTSATADTSKPDESPKTE